jgi:superfamily II DNA helicase RecQ
MISSLLPCDLSNAVLAAIANQLPATPSELAAIKGLGGKKGKTYGDEILGMVVEYCAKKTEEECKVKG